MGPALVHLVQQEDRGKGNLRLHEPRGRGGGACEEVPADVGGIDDGNDLLDLQRSLHLLRGGEALQTDRFEVSWGLGLQGFEGGIVSSCSRP